MGASADPLTRTYQVKVALNGPGNGGAHLPLGATAYVRVLSPGADAVQAIKLPTSALRQAGQGSAVWVYDAANGTVRSREVQVAGADGNEAVIAAGLKPGEQVVVAGVHVLADGQAVTVFKP